jgi:vancomycin resistance protein YoaR
MSVLKEKTDSLSHRHIWMIVFLVAIVLGVACTGTVLYAKKYENRVPPGVHIGDVSIGGMTQPELQEYLHTMNNRLVDAGIHIHFETEDGEKNIVIPPTIRNDNVIDLVYLDVEKEVQEFFAQQNERGFFGRMWGVVLSRVINPDISLRHISLNKEAVLREFKNRLGGEETAVKNASVSIDSLSPLTYSITPSSPGVVFYYDDVADQIISAWSTLTIPNIRIEHSAAEPDIFESDVESILERVPVILEQGDFDVTYTDPHTKREYTWVLDKQTIAEWIEAQRTEDDVIGFGLSASSTKAFLEEEIAGVIDVQAENAKFEVGENGKVLEFQGSRPGVALDLEATYAAINEAILQRSWHDDGVITTLAVLVEQVEPNIKTGEVNELGIDEVLGVGYSNYSGSPPNRIRNIRHAVYNKLNGLLIKPDEDFSLLNALRPFTFEGGYLSELVIKGDKIEPEIGGGLCQIGSTIFRAAMNAGMEITERRNHSLVVSYYNDPRNGNPGTDATIYDPAPDFRFKNNTGNYVLLTTEMNESNGDITFTLWGTSDGRKAYYTEPVVSRWIPTGPAKEVPTTELAPGQRKCQSAHPGAVTSFTYVRELPDGEKIERIFESYYRPLPTICLVGIDGSPAASDKGQRVCEILSNGQESCTIVGEDASS